MGAIASAGKRRVVERVHVVAGSEESEFDLDEEERRVKELQEQNKQVVTYVVENLFPYAPVSIKIQRLDSVAMADAPPAKEKRKMHTYLWITLDELVLKQQNVPLDTTVSYPLVVAVDSTGNAHVTDRNGGQRRLKSSDLVALATAKVPPQPPDPVSFLAATGCSLKVQWKESPGSIVDRFEVQYKHWKDLTSHKPWLVLVNSLMPSNTTLDNLDCHTAFVFRAKCHNPAGWSDFSAVSGPFTTLAGAPDKPTPPFAAIISNTFIHVGWSAAPDNGAPIMSYHLEMKAVVDENATFVQVYAGRDCGYVVPGLAPKFVYIFRLKAVNAVGDTVWVESKPVRTKEFARPEVQELPSDGSTDRWVECWDGKQEKVFFFNKFTCQRTYDIPPEVLALRQKGGADAADESPEMIFRKKRFHFHRELRASVPSSTVPFEVSLARSTMFMDTVARFHRASKKELQLKPRVTFEGEGGIDSGGLTKDWYLQVSQQAAHPSRGLFRPLDKGLLEIHPDADSADHLKLFRFLGKFLGKAIFDRQVVQLPLAPVLYKHLVGLSITTEDLVAMDPQFYKSLKWIEDNDVTDVLYETFSVTRANNVIVDLKENGRNVEVTEANKKEYVALMMQWRTEFAVRPQLDALLNGLHMLLPASLLHAFEWRAFSSRADSRRMLYNSV
ncbi:hypothetical protein, variant [Aphanomyces invadans]|uniref:HECT-type E3 ubiquitin transferase n=1 Tax=Aphanomyces invadans TaxID=157072 RepID=A0A024U4U4_9STRA|nr:hypothetical protein, variant [Aphanomyces invadans]ETW01279.1 hypothetical protein, variant [Aphanomyces invadans]|eukprot:XP_008870277.1 hypothetical protein, variant [Aphanomyces invadans]